MSIDHAARDWIDDTDYMLPRTSQEFPRLASSHTDRKMKKEYPWGKNKPVYIEPFLDENQLLFSQ